MNKAENKMSLISKIVNFFSHTSQSTGDNIGNKTGVTSKAMRDTAREAAAEGIVLLKNDGVLPLKSESNVAVFGRTQINWFCVGYGSGGDVKAPYKNTFAIALKNQDDIKINEDVLEVYEKWCQKHVPDEGFWGHWPFRFEEMPLDFEFVKKAREKSDAAIVVIGRAAGEDREQKLKKGSFYLADDELDMLDKVCAVFEKVVLVLDTGNVIDFEQISGYGDRISAIVLAWQGGMESGGALVDVLSGKVNPSGRLTDSIGVTYDVYPSSNQFGYKNFNVYEEDVFVGYRYFESFAKEEVLYPFGFGLSYTTFDVTASVEGAGRGARVWAKVKNTGDRSGKTVVQVYVKKADGTLVKPARELVAYAKTDLLQSGEEQEFSFDISEYELSSYDEEGATGYKACWVLEYGDYEFFVGENVREAKNVGTVKFDKKITSECHTACTPQKDLKVLEKAVAQSGIKRLASENIYGLYFAKQGYDVIAGEGHNIANVFAVREAKALGASAYIPSCEYKDFPACDDVERIAADEDIPLMTFAHCPYKTIFECECKDCAYKPDLVLEREKRKYVVRRVRLSSCRFELYPL